MSRIADYSVPSLSAFYTRTAIANAPDHTGRLPLSNKDLDLPIPPATLYAPEPYLVPEKGFGADPVSSLGYSPELAVFQSGEH